MSHLGTRLLADRFADTDEGVNSILQEMTGVLHGGDPLPPDVTIYDDTRDSWVARGMAPDAGQGIDFPCIRFMTIGVTYESGVPTVQDTGARTVAGTLQVAAQLILREDAETFDATTAGMYLLRAMRGVIARFDDPDNYDDASRSFGGIRLEMCTAISQGKIDAPLGDTLVSPGALLLSYDILETVPLPLSLH